MTEPLNNFRQTSPQENLNRIQLEDKALNGSIKSSNNKQNFSCTQLLMAAKTGPIVKFFVGIGKSLFNGLWSLANFLFVKIPSSIFPRCFDKQPTSTSRVPKQESIDPNEQTIQKTAETPWATSSSTISQDQIIGEIQSVIRATIPATSNEEGHQSLLTNNLIRALTNGTISEISKNKAILTMVLGEMIRTESDPEEKREVAEKCGQFLIDLKTGMEKYAEQVRKDENLINQDYKKEEERLAKLEVKVEKNDEEVKEILDLKQAQQARQKRIEIDKIRGGNCSLFVSFLNHTAEMLVAAYPQSEGDDSWNNPKANFRRKMSEAGFIVPRQKISR